MRPGAEQEQFKFLIVDAINQKPIRLLFASVPEHITGISKSSGISVVACSPVISFLSEWTRRLVWFLGYIFAAVCQFIEHHDLSSLLINVFVNLICSWFRAYLVFLALCNCIIPKAMGDFSHMKAKGISEYFCVKHNPVCRCLWFKPYWTDSQFKVLFSFNLIPEK